MHMLFPHVQHGVVFSEMSIESTNIAEDLNSHLKESLWRLVKAEI